MGNPGLGKADPNESDMLQLTSLMAGFGSYISNLTGLEYASNLVDLRLHML